MTKPDDSTLTPADLLIVEERARQLMDRAGGWNTFPVPLEEIMAAAKVKLAPTSAFDPAAILAYLKGKATEVGVTIKSAIAKVFGIYDAAESLIHVDSTVGKPKQTFLTLHETAHHDLPVHRKMFRFFQDCEKTLAPDISDQFEREANNFARFLLFKGDAYAKHAADNAFSIKTPMKLATHFGASVYASAREFARTNHRVCAVYVLEPIEYVAGAGARAMVRRIEPSPSFVTQFGQPACTVVTPDHFLGPILPIGRKMTRPTGFSLTDRNGDAHECVGEAFDTTRNVIILFYPVKALQKSIVVLTANAS